jgi:hypothetical protein
MSLSIEPGRNLQNIEIPWLIDEQERACNCSDGFIHRVTDIGVAVDVCYQSNQEANSSRFIAYTKFSPQVSYRMTLFLQVPQLGKERQRGRTSEMMLWCRNTHYLLNFLIAGGKGLITGNSLKPMAKQRSLKNSDKFDKLLFMESVQF